MTAGVSSSQQIIARLWKTGSQACDGCWSAFARSTNVSTSSWIEFQYIHLYLHYLLREGPSVHTHFTFRNYKNELRKINNYVCIPTRRHRMLESATGIATRLPAGRPGNCGSIAGRRNRSASSPKRPRCIRAPLCILLSEYWEFLPKGKRSQGVKLTTHHQLSLICLLVLRLMQAEYFLFSTAA
jgi:hypothetical protein